MTKYLSFALLQIAVWTLMAHPAAAQAPPLHDALLDHMIGTWELRGMVDGKMTTYDVDSAWVMGHQYVRVHEVSPEKKADGTPEYESVIYIAWNAGQQQYACVAMDTHGGLSQYSMGVAKRQANAIPFITREGGQEFQTIFAYSPASDTWTWRLGYVHNKKLVLVTLLTMTRVAKDHNGLVQLNK